MACLGVRWVGVHSLFFNVHAYLHACPERVHDARRAQELLSLLKGEHQLMARLSSLKHYFLLDQGDFLVHFMDIAGEELDKPSADISKPRLQSLLELCEPPRSLGGFRVKRSVREPLTVFKLYRCKGFSTLYLFWNFLYSPYEGCQISIWDAGCARPLAFLVVRGLELFCVLVARLQRSWDCLSDSDVVCSQISFDPWFCELPKSLSQNPSGSWMFCRPMFRTTRYPGVVV